MSDRSLIPNFPSIAEAFPLHGTLKDWRPYGSGHINDTLAVSYDHAGADVRYIFQRINHSIFKNVPALMDNISRVSKHAAIKGDSKDSRSSLRLVSTLDGSPFYQTKEGDYWRVYLFIEQARTYDELKSPQQAFEAARAFGRFQRLLEDLPGARLHETIPNFHNTRARFEALRAAAEADVVGRKDEVKAELDFAFRNEAIVDRLLDLAKSGAIPERVTHNDTKINNVMLDNATGEGICVIDLDTVMPGLSLYDFGDMVRSGVSPAAEDECNLDRICVRTEFFEALLRGFVEGVGPILTEAEWENLAFSARLITFEIGLRFLTDYLQGDTYFKTKRLGHNLHRCRTQFRLVQCLEEASTELDRLVSEVRRG